MGWLIAAGLGYLFFKNQPSTSNAIASAGSAATQAGAALETVAIDITGSPIAPNHANIAPGVLSENAGAPLPVPPKMAPVTFPVVIPPLPVAPRFSLPVPAQRIALSAAVRQMFVE